MIMLDESLMNLLEGFVGFVNNEVEYFCSMRIMEKGTIGSRTLPISYHIKNVFQKVSSQRLPSPQTCHVDCLCIRRQHGQMVLSCRGVCMSFST
jgi:hypothetical protein